ncbi:hypothetical protein [Demequina activiva]|uniref:Leucine rich repeat variant n=1 Tax=Demequina activiva TaxID=1582364 RepID=A0A919UGG4_9MICO|nr:hypothetical protein [Demequina activiva]GIG54807.1 hypothetical protein Dac01nite_15590 [Demequina activiva]
MARGFNYAPGASDEVELAGKPDLTRTMVQSLASGRNAVVREVIAQRGDLPLGTMVGLAHDRATEVRAALAANPAATEPVLEHLSTDRHVEVLHAVIANPQVPAGIVERLAFHRKDEVRSHAVRRLDELAPVHESVDHGTPELREREPMADVVPMRSQQVSLHDQGGPRPVRTAPVRGFLPAEEA